MKWALILIPVIGEIIVTKPRFNILAAHRSYQDTTSSGKRLEKQNWNYYSWAGCSKLTTSLVNVSLNFQTSISEKCQYFLLKICVKLLQCKSSSQFSNKKYQCFWLQSHKHLKSWPLNELVKLTMLWTNGPWAGTLEPEFQNIWGNLVWHFDVYKVACNQPIYQLILAFNKSY